MHLADRDINGDATCGLGSLKTNIGHLEAAAGIAGVLKVLLSMQKGYLPPTINFEKLNEKIELQNTPYYIQDKLQPWHTSEKSGTTIAGISSFGIGGVNAHLLLESYPAMPASPKVVNNNEPYIFILSAKNTERLKVYASKIIEYIKFNHAIDALQFCYTLQIAREELDERLAIVFENIDELLLELAFYTNGEPLNSGFTGNSKTDLKAIEIFDENTSILETWLKTGNFKSIAKYWSYGLAIDWKLFYANQQIAKISLPGYPFARESYWIPENLQKAQFTGATNAHAAGSAGIDHSLNAGNISGGLSSAKDSRSIEKKIEKMAGWLSDCISDELKLPVELLERDTQFNEYGMDSVLLMRVIRKIEKEFKGVLLDPSEFLENSTIAELSDYLVQHHLNDFKSILKEENIFERPVAGVDSYTKEKIAVVGMACHFPDAGNIGEYWDNLKAGRDSITEVPASRWKIADHFDAAGKPGKSISKWGAFLPDIEMFDPGFFGVSAKLASYIDPLERQWLEVSTEALMDAGYHRKALWGKNVGVFAGSRTANFASKIKTPEKDFYVGTGQNFITAHLAHINNFKGPTVVIDTACSSSITAIHLAIQSLITRESEVALAGGVDILLDEKPYISLSAAQILSKDGKSKTFDAAANGTGLGEGCGVLVLKRLSNAIEDGNKIYGIIEASATNNDGNTMGITTPNPKSQQALIETAINNAGVESRSITYIETHGTGTAIGDPIELRGITNALGVADKQFCGVGSVKTNIGHLLSASGIAGVIKVLLSITAKQLPPTLNCQSPNPRFDFINSAVYPVFKLEDWSGYENVLRAGISAFGLGGSNAHLIVSNEGIPEANQVKVPLSISPVNYKKIKCWPVDDIDDLKQEPENEDVLAHYFDFKKV